MEMTTLAAFLEGIALSAVAALGFALVFNVPRCALAYCAMGGALGFALRFWLLLAAVPLEWATLLAASCVSFVGVYWARKLGAHPKVFTVAAIIPLIPGKSAFAAALALFQIRSGGYSPELHAQLVDAFLQMSFVTASIAFGLAMPGLLWYRRKPVV